MGFFQTLRECELVPLNASELDARVSGARSASGELLRSLPAVLRALCTILLAQRQRLRAAAQSQPLAAQNNKVHNITFVLISLLYHTFQLPVLDKVRLWVRDKKSEFKFHRRLKVLTIMNMYINTIFFTLQQVEWLREQAEVLNTFAGNIAYRMPGDTYSQLAQMQILMH